MHSTERIRRALRLMVSIRWIGAGLILGIPFVKLAVGQEPFYLPAQEILSLFALIAGMNVYFTYATWRLKGDSSQQKLMRLGSIQIIFDLLFITVMVYMTGGANSDAYTMYMYSFFTAALLYFDVRVIKTIVAATLFYTLVILMELYGVIDHRSLPDQPIVIYGDASATYFHLFFTYVRAALIGMVAWIFVYLIRSREEQIQIEQRNMQSLLQSLEAGLLLTDKDNRVMLFNDPAQRFLCSKHIHIGTILTENICNESASPILRVVLAQPKEKQLSQEVVVEHNLGKTTLAIDSIPILNPDKHIEHWAHVFHNITREREFEQMQSDFVSTAAHQLRTPLASFKWFFVSFMDEDSGGLSVFQKKMLTKASEKNEEMIELVNDLLDISEIEDGRYQFFYKKTSVYQLLAASMFSVKDHADRKNIVLDFDRNSPEEADVSVDLSKMQMALKNLLENAIKYSSEDGKVTVSVAVTDDTCTIGITDSGIGIPVHQQDNIFEKFFRADNAKREVIIGSGLGLFIVREIVEQHGGKVWCESAENMGATFFVQLPRIQ